MLGKFSNISSVKKTRLFLTSLQKAQEIYYKFKQHRHKKGGGGGKIEIISVIDSMAASVPSSIHLAFASYECY